MTALIVDTARLMKCGYAPNPEPPTSAPRFYWHNAIESDPTSEFVCNVVMGSCLFARIVTTVTGNSRYFYGTTIFRELSREYWFSLVRTDAQLIERI